LQRRPGTPRNISAAQTRASLSITLNLGKQPVDQQLCNPRNAPDQRRARELIDTNRDWITYHTQLDNPAVLQLMRKADIGLLPTYADTYGYVVLEYQAAGCPVITTDIRAMSEINDDLKGCLIGVPKNPLGEAIYTTATDREQISRPIHAGLSRRVQEIFTNRSVITAKAAHALQNIVEKHDPLQVSARFKAIYTEALG
jgi:glycosyltransferase involved in cell wall biosynthesis